MKKFLKIFAVLFTCFGLTSCGNMDIGFGNFNFTGAHIFNTSTDYTVKQWNESKVGVEVKLEDDNVLFLSEGTYMLYSDHCPICSASSTND